MPVVQINGKVLWKCFRTNSGSWIGTCDSLKFTVESETWALLMKDIGESINASLKELFESDQFDRFLRDHAWKVFGTLPTRTKSIYFDVPFLASLADGEKSHQKMVSALMKSALFKDGWRKFKFQPASRRLTRKQRKAKPF